MVRCKGYGLTKERSGSVFSASLGEMNSYLQMVSEDRGLGHLERHAFRMSSCYLSQQPLKEPVVACKLGNLYNKEVLITHLLNKTVPKELSHIRALKDVKLCLITWKEAEKEGRRRMVCPVSREDLDSGGSRAVIIWSSGALVSPKSLKELKLKECPVTNKAFDADKDVIPLAPEGEELERLRSRLPVVAAKKRKAADPTASASATTGEEATSASSSAATTEATSGKAQKTKEGEAAKTKDTKIYKDLFIKENKAFGGARDGFGTPAFNRGEAVK